MFRHLKHYFVLQNIRKNSSKLSPINLKLIKFNLTNDEVNNLIVNCKNLKKLILVDKNVREFVVDELNNSLEAF